MSHILPLIRRIAEKTKLNQGNGRVEKFFVFAFGAKEYAVPAVDITEILIPGSLISVMQESEFVMGVVNIRGTVVPVINLRERLGLPEDYLIEDDSRLLVFTLKPGSYVAVVADRIESRLRDGILQRLPEEACQNEEKVFGSAFIDDKKYHVFFIDQWLEPEEIKILQNIAESY
ncbi:MAG: chemotaxis protein CheW [Candidatus Rifleibacteriota bacterium]